MAVPKCMECENHHHENNQQTTINISATRIVANKSIKRAHFCRNKESFKYEYQTGRWIPTVDMGSTSPKWCPKRKAADAT